MNVHFFFKQLKKGTINLPENFKSKNLLDGVNIIKDIFQEEQIDIEKFSKKFFRETFIFRTELPKGTNLNHYFEIMNNRGEQLEKHEILKAQLMETLQNDERKSDLFSKIWDSCSDMGDYIWNNFDKNFDKNFVLKIFEQDYSNYNFNELFTNLSFPISENINNEKDNNDLDRILDTHHIPSNFSQRDQEKTAKFRSVIDFPDLLIYTFNLKIKKTDEASYDDKKLLEIFKDYTDSEVFIVELLKTRIYFDRYVIKQMLNTDEKDQNWGIRSFEIKDNSVQNKEKTFDDAEDPESIETKIEMFQTMFYYSSISSNKKDWLVKILIAKKENVKDLYDVIFENFRSEISNLVLKEQIYPYVQTKTFYYFEYMFWEFYNDYLRGDKKNNIEIPDGLKALGNKVKNNLNLFSEYKFRQINSKEHILSQDKFHSFRNILKIEETDLHCFKNLCLISNSENSSAGNKNHFEKKNYFKNNNYSLKRLMIFESFDNLNWDVLEMKNHEDDLQNLLDYYKKK